VKLTAQSVYHVSRKLKFVKISDLVILKTFFLKFQIRRKSEKGQTYSKVKFTALFQALRKSMALMLTYICS
jgi:hypothetical protein